MMPFSASAAAAAAAAAAAVAAQINASIAAQQRLMAPKPEPKAYFEEDVDINHCKNKHILTKGSTHNQIQSVTGAVVIARGRYKPIGDCSAEDPLHLHVSADTEEKVKTAVERIKHIMGPNPLKAYPASAVCTVGFEPTAGFDSVAEIQGPQGEFLNHIKLETNISEIFIRGRGALPPHNEASEPLHVYIGASNGTAVQSARGLVDNLLETVRLKYRQFCAQLQASIPPPVYPNNQAQGYSGYPMQSPAYCSPAYPTLEIAGGMAYGVAPMYQCVQSSTNGSGWGDGVASSWGAEGNRWGYGGQGQGTGNKKASSGKPSYNSVGPPASIAYEHQIVMAEEGCSAVSSGSASFPSAETDSGVEKERADRWQRDEREMREERRNDNNGPSPPHEKRDRKGPSPPRKRRFVEFVAEEGPQVPAARDVATDAASSPTPSQPAPKVPNEASATKPPLKKLPPVPTFPGPKGPSVAWRVDGGFAAPAVGTTSFSNGNSRAVGKESKSDAISLLLDEYEEDD